MQDIVKEGLTMILQGNINWPTQQDIQQLLQEQIEEIGRFDTQNQEFILDLQQQAKENRNVILITKKLHALTYNRENKIKNLNT